MLAAPFDQLLITIGVLGWVALRVGALRGRQYFPLVLRRWGRHRSVGVEFVLGPDRRLREGAAVAEALGRLHLRQVEALFVVGAAFGVSDELLAHGPRLSQSTANSWAVAGIPFLATVLAVLRLRAYFDPYRTDGGRPRAVEPEDYVMPVARVLAWVTAPVGLLVPILFAVLAAGPSYDADTVFWEGVLLQAPVGSVIVLLTERWLRRVTDVAARDDATLYVWDCLRTRATQLLFILAFVNLTLGLRLDVEVLNGVSLTVPDPSWLGRLSSLLWLLGLVALAGLVAALLQPVASRLRARLWPDLPPDERIEFGRALPIP